MADKTPSKPRRNRIGLAILLVLVIVASIVGIPYLTSERKPLPEAIEALRSDTQVLVSIDPWLALEPVQSSPKAGLIFYPGGRIDPAGYAPLMKAVAAEGYLVVVPEMPLNIAAFRPNAANAIVEHYSDIANWSIGGHSVGAVMAAQYTSRHSDVIDGLVLWAGYPAGNADLSSFDQDVTLVYGSLDPQATEEGVEQRRHLLPADTTYVRIEGGDHHQFGSYEIEPEDHHATIDRQSQHQQILAATLALLVQASDTG